MIKRQYVLLTTSRRPTKHLRTLCRDLSHTFPTTVRINRGKLSLEGIAEKALEFDVEKVMIVERWNEGVAQILLFEAGQDGLKRVPLTLYVRSVKFRRDFGEHTPKGRRIKSIAIAASPKENFETNKLQNALSGFLGVPLLTLEEAINSKYDAVMQIFMNSSNHVIVTFKLIPELVEMGPQLGISHLVWELT